MNFLLIPLAGLFAMDRLTAFNSMVSRPIVVSVIVSATGGGSVVWCLLGGIFFEFIGLMDLPVGTRISRDDTFGAFAYAVMITYSGIEGVFYALLAMVIAFFIMFPVSYSSVFIRWINKLLLHRYKKAHAQNFEGRLILFGQILSFLRGVFFYTLGAAACMGLFLLVMSHVTPETMHMGFLLIPAALLLGYFAGFFHTSLLSKILLLAAGGAFSWLVL